MNIYIPLEVSPSEVLVIYIGVTNESQQKRKKIYFAKCRMKTGEESQLVIGLNKLNLNFMFENFAK